MRTLFDTSVLVAALEVSHLRHAVCLPWLQRAQTEQIYGIIATHTLAKVYSVLTLLCLMIGTENPADKGVLLLIPSCFQTYFFIQLLEHLPKFQQR